MVSLLKIAGVAAVTAVGGVIVLIRCRRMPDCCVARDIGSPQSPRPPGSPGGVVPEEEEEEAPGYRFRGMTTGGVVLEFTEGDKLPGLPNGQGEVVWEDGDRYAGQWKEGTMHGIGCFIFAGSGKLPSGVMGSSLYKGEWKDGQKNGVGYYEYADGDWYYGDWKEDERHGYGVYYHAATEEKDAGMYRDGEDVGEGVKYSKDTTRTWLLVDGKIGDPITTERAAQIVATHPPRPIAALGEGVRPQLHDIGKSK
eukprot:Hpha_TRINITY_DN5734_c0_g1::TRINITY_DN5734_c0_g1_i1::g.147657::m.147657